MRGLRPTRRAVLAALAVAGGFAVGFGVADARAQRKGRKQRRRPRKPPSAHELGVWIVVTSDDRVVVRVARSEMGQGIATGLAQLAAEEIDCEWEQVRVDFVLPGESLRRMRAWGDFTTSNSRSIRSVGPLLREAGAAARWMLLGAAAAQWKVAQSELAAEDGKVVHRSSGRAVSFGRLAEAASKVVPPPRSALKLKPVEAWKYIGARRAAIDNKNKVTGRAVYGTDVRLPGLLNAAIKAAPVAGGTIAGFDASIAETMPGVRRVLQVGEDAIAVVAESWWQARAALEKVTIVWAAAVDAGISDESIAAYLKTGLETTAAFVGRTHGDALEAIRQANQTLEAVYETPFLHHAALEPMNATALWRPDRIEVWAPSQNAEAALKTAAEAAGLPVEQAEVHRTAVGGSFGRRLKQDAVRQAVLIARALPGRPIKLIWSRGEDTAHGHYRPVTQAKLRAALDDKGEPTGLIMRISGQSILISNLPRAASIQTGRDPRMFQGLHAQPGESQMAYSIANLYIDHAMRNTHLPVGSWRGVHTTQNGVYLECFIDEMAHAAKRDPLEFRTSLMKGHPLHLAVLIAAATRAGWGTPTAPGLYRGLAQMMAVGSYAAAVAEISVSPEGEVRVKRVVVALDCGTVVNPQLVEAQVEGSVMMATSATLGEKISIRGGQVVERDFDSYPILRMAEAPAVECVIVPSGDFWGGVGGAVMGVVAPAILNAVFAATGRRVRSLPLGAVRPK
ncbi:MAG: molybdopterin cofactor-binding domain-containing protein [Hyphomicrobiaceae bacterium]